MTGARRVVVLIALSCSSSCADVLSPLPLDDPRSRPGHSIEVELGARVASEGDGFVVFATLHNPTGASLTLSTGTCPYRLRAYASEALDDPAFWDDRTEHPMPCVDVGLHRVVPPGNSELVLGRRSWSDLAMGFPRRAGHWGVVVVHNGDLRVLSGGRIGGE